VLALLTVLALLVPALAFAGSGAADRTRMVAKAVEGGRARNVLLFIGDGMGDSEITIARNYAVGAGGRLTMDRFPLTGAYTTYALQEADPSLPDYVTDSAASGTGWATGHKTSNGRISTTAGTDSDLPTILELAQARGFRTGDVSTAELTDATPAVLVAHVAARACQGPADMASCPQDRKSAGGPGSIAEQQVDHHVDVLLGGGRQRFEQTVDAGPDAGRTVTESARRQGYQVVTDAASLAAAGATPLLGLFSAGNMSLEWTGELARPYPGSGPQRCVEGQRPAAQPSLADMTTKAISLLEAKAKDRRHGFFLQVEGASIDKQDHAENPCGQIGETVAFDHGHTSQIIEPQTATDHSPGAISTLITADGANMVVNYATNLDGRSRAHTGTQVRIAAQGPQAANVAGVTDQTDLFSTMARALGLAT
jgi:alkaline phosphatase/streptomycin-6-phosphatase